MRLKDVGIEKEDCTWLGDYVAKVTAYVVEEFEDEKRIDIDKELYSIISMSPNFRFGKGSNNDTLLDKEVFLV